MFSFNTNEINASVFGQIESTFNIETKDLFIIDSSIHFISVLFSFTSPAIPGGIRAQMTAAEEQLLPHYVWHYRPMKDTTCPQIPTAVAVSTKSDGRYRLLFRINHFPIKPMKDATTRYL